jgi:hypothetical protein
MSDEYRAIRLDGAGPEAIGEMLTKASDQGFHWVDEARRHRRVLIRRRVPLCPRPVARFLAPRPFDAGTYRSCCCC